MCCMLLCCMLLRCVLPQCVCKDIFSGEQFSIPYDNLVIATGAQTNTFGVPGVTPENHVYFLKQLSDARRIRTRLLECFERASNTFCTPEERSRLLSFVIVGGKSS
jgi:NADH dehydrogenase FAD-containing subunit